MKKTGFILFVFILLPGVNYSQQSRKFFYTAGIGYMQGINAGASFDLKDSIQNLGFSLGCFDILHPENKYYSATVEHSASIFRSVINKHHRYKWYINNKVTFWYMEDPYYKWGSLSFIPSAKRLFMFSEQIDVSIDFGISCNLILYNKRKTLEEVGWPYHILPDLRIIFIF